MVTSRAAGIRLLFLPPFSPDFNPIEKLFSKIKAWIRCHNDLLTYGDLSGPHAFLYDLLEVLNVVTEEDAIGYFIHTCRLFLIELFTCGP